MTNRKSHTPFWLLPTLTTLGDLERPIRTLLQKRCVFRSPTTKSWMKIDPYYQQQKCRPMTLVSGGIRLMRIFRKVPLGRGVKRQWGCRDRQVFAGYFFGYFSVDWMRWSQRYYMARCSSSSAFQWSQNAWPWMTMDGYFALNSVFCRFGWLTPCDIGK